MGKKKKKDKKLTQAEVDALQAAVVSDQASRLSSAEAETRTLRRQLKEVQREHGKALEFNDELRTAVRALPTARWKKPARGARSMAEVALVLLLGDWHTGERIREDEMEGFNEYDYAIQCARLEMLCDKVLEWTSIMRKGYVTRRWYIIGLGDFISGDERVHRAGPGGQGGASAGTNDCAVRARV